MSIVPYAMQMPGLMPAYSPAYRRAAPRRRRSRTYRRRAPRGKVCTAKKCYKRKSSVLLKKSNWAQDVIDGTLIYRMLSGPKEARDVIRDGAKQRVAKAKIERQIAKAQLANAPGTL